MNFNTTENVKRIIRQQAGDPSFFYLSILSFFEGYMRYTCNIPFTGNEIKFSQIFESFISLQGYAKNSPEIDNLNNLKKFKTSWGKYKVNKIPIRIDSDRIRHCFDEQNINIIPLLVDEFITFSKNNGFYNETEFQDLENGEYLRILKEKKKPVSNKIFEEITKRLQEMSSKYAQNISSFEKLQAENLAKDKDILNLQQELSLYQEVNDENASQISKLQTKLEALESDKDKTAEEYQVLLLQLLEYSSARRDFDSRVINLTEEQEKIVSFIMNNIDNSNLKNKDYLIKGGPGTGKTLVLIDCLRLLFLQHKNVVFLTYSRSLCKYSRYLTKEYNIKNSNLNNYDKILDNIKVYDDFFSKLLLNTFNIVVLPSIEYKNILITKIDNINTSRTKSESILREATEEIWPNLLSEDEYIHGKLFIGNNKFRSAEIEQRREIWKVITKINKLLLSEKTWPKEFSYWAICNNKKYSSFNDTDKLDVLLVDEVQDLSRAQIKALSYIAKNNIILAGDGNQIIYQKYDINWKDLNINIKGHSKSLKTNLRSTFQIQTFANIYREKMPLKDKSVYSEGILPGQFPELFITSSFDESKKSIINYVNFCINQLFFSKKDICIICASDNELHELNSQIPDSERIDNESFSFEKDCIRLSTIKFVKGIDSPVVVMCLTKSILNETLNGHLKKKNQMNAIYSSITRAMDILRIYITDDYYENDKKNSLSILVDVYKNSN